jgi:serine/threonine protein kinase
MARRVVTSVAQAMTDSSSSPSAPIAGTGPAPGEIIAGKYVVESLLGVGGMGVVVAARHVHLNQSVAIKLLRPEASGSASTSRFLREARAAAAIRSEHVARVLDVGTLETGLPFIVMEHLAGCDLATLIEARGRIPYGEAVSLVLQACEAIAEAHAIGIVHRDLKPSNVFVTSRADGTALVKVLDFGISKMQNPLAFSGAEATLTASGSVLGSPAYMSPEQIRSAKGTDPRSDVWAMGVILYELVTGRNPFIGETIGDTLVKIASEAAPSVRAGAEDVPEGLAAVIEGCLMRDPAKRTPSIVELAQALQPFAAGDVSAGVERIARVAAAARALSVTTPADGDPAETPPRPVSPDPRGTHKAWQQSPAAGRGRRGAAWIAGGGLALLVGLGVATQWARAPRPPPGVPLIATSAIPPNLSDETDASGGATITPLPTRESLVEASVMLAHEDAGAPLGARPADRRHGKHGGLAATPAAGAPPATGSTPAAPASSNPRTLDDLLEGRH